LKQAETSQNPGPLVVAARQLIDEARRGNGAASAAGSPQASA